MKWKPDMKLVDDVKNSTSVKQAEPKGYGKVEYL